jgi:hypothetical protein
MTQCYRQAGSVWRHALKMTAGNSRAAYMREYRKRKRLEEDNCSNVPKRIKLSVERQREYRETHKTNLLIICVIAENQIWGKTSGKLIYSSTNPSFITVSTLILGAKVPATFFCVCELVGHKLQRGCFRRMGVISAHYPKWRCRLLGVWGYVVKTLTIFMSRRWIIEK